SAADVPRRERASTTMTPPRNADIAPFAPGLRAQHGQYGLPANPSTSITHSRASSPASAGSRPPRGGSYQAYWPLSHAATSTSADARTSTYCASRPPILAEAGPVAVDHHLVSARPSPSTDREAKSSTADPLDQWHGSLYTRS